MRAIAIFVCAAALAAGARAHAAPAAPAADDVRAKARDAAKLAADDDNDKALAIIHDALATSPRDLQLLELEGSVLLKMRDYEGALAAYQAYIDAGASGANRRTAQRIVASLAVVKTTFVDITVSNGPAAIYFDSKVQGLMCTAQPECKKGVLPGDYKVIAERAGFERWTGRITITAKHTSPLAITLIEKPSQLTVSVATPGATITLDGAPFSGSGAVPGGDHELVVQLAHFATVKRAVAAHEGRPVALDVALVPLVPVTVSTAADLTLDGGQLVIEDGAVALPPGAHEIRAHAAGFHDAVAAVPAERAADYHLAFALAPIGAMVDVSGAPAGAALVVDGKAIATTPLAAPIEIAGGTHEVEVRVDGFLPYRERRAFPGNQAALVHVAKLRPDTKKRTYLAGAGTGVALVFGGISSALAVQHRNEYNARAGLPGVTASDPELHSLKSGGDRWAIGADAGLGLGVLGIAATTYLWTHEGRGESEGSIRIGVGPGVATLSGRF